MDTDMGFDQRNRPTKSQVSLNSWKDDAKQGAKNAAHDVKEAVVGSAKNVGHAAVRAVKSVADWQGVSSNNKDLKAKMRGHSGFRERTRSHDD